MEKNVFIFISLMFISCSSKNLDNECRPLVNNFFTKVHENKHMDAIDELLSSNNYIDKRDSSVFDLKRKFDFLNVSSGDYIGNKLLLKRNINDDVIIYSYLVKYQKKFYRFIFIFYKAETEPVLYRFAFDDNIETEIMESVNLYLNYNL